MNEQIEVATGAGIIECGVTGEGAIVVLLPGRGGSGIEQYQALGEVVAEAGYKVVAVNPRGVGRSRGPLEGITLHDFASDVRAVIEHFGVYAHVIGRAFGNRIARCVSADYPSAVRSLSLLAAGGLYPPAAWRPTSLRTANPPWTYWKDAGYAQECASRTTPLTEWWSGGVAPMLVIQGLDDHIAVPQNGQCLKRDHPDRVRLREFADAGHFVLLEKPVPVISEVLTFLGDVESGAAIE